MALLDTLFGGAPQAEMLGGLLGEDKMNQLRSQATNTGLVNAVIGYLAQPKNQRFGSALPYLARAVVAGQQGAQGVYDDALRNYQFQQKMEEVNREKAARAEFEKARGNLFTTIPAQYQEVSTPGGYAPQQETVMEGQVRPNYGLTKLPDVTSKVMTAPEQQVMNEQALQQMMLSGDPRAASYLTGLKTLRELSARPKRETAVVDGNLVDVNTEKVIFTAPTKPQKGSTLSQLQAEYDSFPPNDPRRVTWLKAIEKEISPSQGVTVNYGAPVAGVDAQGNQVFFQPSKGGGAPAIVQGVAPLREEKAPTEAQAKAGAFGSQMQTASKEFERLQKEGFDPTSVGAQASTALAGTPFTMLADPKAQQANQAQQQWSEAYLRFKTGAAATEAEVIRNQRTFFPQFGDSPEVIAQKARMRKQAEQDVLGTAKQKPQPQQQVTQPKGLSVGQVVNGYRYKGGDPKDKNNWEKK